MFKHLDDWLIDAVFQKVADWYQGLTGRNNYGLAALVFTVMSVFDFAILLIQYRDTGTITFFKLINPLIGILLAGHALRYEGLFGGTRGSGLASYFRHMPLYRLMRGLQTAFVIFDVIRLKSVLESADSILWAISGLAFWSALYLEACSPRQPPPKEERLVLQPAAS